MRLLLSLSAVFCCAVISLFAAQADAAAPLDLRVNASPALLRLYCLESVLGLPARTPVLADLICAPDDKQSKAPVFGPDAGRLVTPPERCARAREAGRRALRALPRDLLRIPGLHGTPPVQSPEEVLEGLAAHAISTDSFFERAEGAVPGPVLTELRSALSELEPLIARRVEGTRTRTQKLAPDAIGALLDKHGAPAFLGDVAALFGSRLPTALLVSLVPVPIRRGTGVKTFAHQAGPVVVVEVLDDDDLEHRVGVAVHELVHVLWFARSPARSKALDDAFAALSRPESHVALALLNEGLATALGNGLFELRASGGLPDGSWYADEAIDGYARVLLPLLQARIAAEQTLDSSFASQATRVLAARFEGMASDPRFAFRRVLVVRVGEVMADRDLANRIRAHLRAQRVRVVSPPPPGGQLGAEPSDTVLLVSTPQRVDALAAFLHPDRLRELVGSKEGEPPKKGAAATCRHGSGRWYAIVLASNAKEVDAALSRIAGAAPMPECGRVE